MEVELEKKFLLDEIPGDLGEPVMIQQGYLYISPFELRVRKMGSNYFITYKGEGDEERVEWEQEIPSWLYEKLLMKKVGNLITKKRYRLERDGYVYQVDEYLGEFSGSIIVEVEFKSRKDYDAYQKPD
jgi:CYTH domain-containing protein